MRTTLLVFGIITILAVITVIALQSGIAFPRG